MAERPYLPASQFRSLVPTAELELITTSLSSAIEKTFAIEGIDPYIPQFPAIYSACVFPRIMGRLLTEFRDFPEWEVRKSRMTFTLVKKGVCQFHFYKGDKDKAFKAESKRQKAIANGLNYGDLDSTLPSVILRHNSDKLKSRLVSLQALFFEDGKQKDAVDILHNIHVSTPTISDELHQQQSNNLGLSVGFRRRSANTSADIAVREKERAGGKPKSSLDNRKNSSAKKSKG